MALQGDVGSAPEARQRGWVRWSVRHLTGRSVHVVSVGRRRRQRWGGAAAALCGPGCAAPCGLGVAVCLMPVASVSQCTAHVDSVAVLGGRLQWMWQCGRMPQRPSSARQPRSMGWHRRWATPTTPFHALASCQPYLPPPHQCGQPTHPSAAASIHPAPPPPPHSPVRSLASVFRRRTHTAWTTWWRRCKMRVRGAATAMRRHLRSRHH